mmetsp:Transcript_244/g.592  ORF Transcript_244/g.592 Transcript_244/m.592 type:complete len:219 (-) Transcript_244:133-789(-)
MRVVFSFSLKEGKPSTNTVRFWRSTHVHIANICVVHWVSVVAAIVVPVGGVAPPFAVAVAVVCLTILDPTAHHSSECTILEIFDIFGHLDACIIFGVCPQHWIDPCVGRGPTLVNIHTIQIVCFSFFVPRSATIHKCLIPHQVVLPRYGRKWKERIVVLVLEGLPTRPPDLACRFSVCRHAKHQSKLRLHVVTATRVSCLLLQQDEKLIVGTTAVISP